MKIMYLAWLFVWCVLTSSAMQMISPELKLIIAEMIAIDKSPVQFGKALRCLQATDRHWRDLVVAKTDHLAQHRAKYFQTSPLLPSLYLGNSRAREFFKREVAAASRETLSDLLEKTILLYSGTRQQNSILRKLVDLDAQLSEPDAIKLLHIRYKRVLYHQHSIDLECSWFHRESEGDYLLFAKYMHAHDDNGFEQQNKFFDPHFQPVYLAIDPIQTIHVYQQDDGDLLFVVLNDDLFSLMQTSHRGKDKKKFNYYRKLDIESFSR